MSTNEPTRTWWIPCFAAVFFLYACADDEAAAAAEPDTPESSRDSSTDDASASASDAAPREDAATDGPAPAGEDSAVSSDCPEPIPMGDLQDQASGPSVFGRIVGGEYGFFDQFGDSTCGIAGARICVLDTETCTESDQAGQFVLKGLPEDTDVEISIEKAELVPTLRLVHIQRAPINLNKTRLIRLSDRSAVHERLGLEYDASKGGMVAVAITPGESIGSVRAPAGVTIKLMPDGLEPYYSLGTLEPGGLSSDELDPDLETTRDGGWALFPNVEPGDYTVRFERDGAPCSYVPGFGLGADELGDVRVRIRSGFSTASIVGLCQ